MQNNALQMASDAIEYIEEHLASDITLGDLARQLYYSRCHLQRVFRQVVGISPHTYSVRRRLTRAAWLLTHTNTPIVQIALGCGYQSQQSFGAAFLAMYKLSPAKFRLQGSFYPLQSHVELLQGDMLPRFAPANVRHATGADWQSYMRLGAICVDGFPHWHRRAFLQALQAATASHRALVLDHGGRVVALCIVSATAPHIDYIALHPQYRHTGGDTALLQYLQCQVYPGQTITTTTYRPGDKADTGYYHWLVGLGFVPLGHLTEYGYPTCLLGLKPLHCQ